MDYAMAFLLLLLAVVIHEFGHAFAMHKYGIKLSRCGIGLPWPKKLRIPLFKLYGARVYFHPLLLGAYVEPENGEDVKALPIGDQNIIYAAGVWLNMLCAFGAFALFSLGRGLVVYGSISLILTVITYKARRSFANFMVPILGLAQIVLFVLVILDMTNGGGSSSGGAAGTPPVAGPVGTVKIIGDVGLPYLFVFSVMSLALGLTNMLPIFPMDGGHIFVNVLEKLRVPRPVRTLVQRVGVVFFIILIAGVLVSDALFLS